MSGVAIDIHSRRSNTSAYNGSNGASSHRGAADNANASDDGGKTSANKKLEGISSEPSDVKYVKRAYRNWPMWVLRTLVAPSLLFFALFTFFQRPSDLVRVVTSDEYRHLFIWSIVVAVTLTVIWMYRMWRRVVYLVDFQTYQGPDELKVPHEVFNTISKECGWFGPDALDFQAKLLAKSEVSGDSYLPPAVLARPPQLTMANARKEAEVVMFTCIEQLLQRTGVRPHSIDILVVNCSLFCPTPSLASMIVNHFKMKTGIKSFNLGGMGCSAGLIAIDLAKDMLILHKNALALVVSMENITQNWYRGNEKSMLISNTLFRMGGAAVLLSNKSKDASRARFKLLHTVRTHKGADDSAYKVVFQEEDPAGHRGVSLSKNILVVASDALRTNITTLGPLVLPYSEQLKYFINLVARSLIKGEVSSAVPGCMRNCLRRTGAKYLYLPRFEDRSTRAKIARCLRSLAHVDTPTEKEKIDTLYEKHTDGMYSGKAYTPSFRKAFQYYCIHAGGRAVIDAIEQHLGLTKEEVAASRYTLSRYGNTSSSSIWYELDYHCRVSGNPPSKGQRVWQIAFGSGFKCNSAVWEAI